MDEFKEFLEDDKPETWTRSLEEGRESDLAHFKEDEKPSSIYAYLLYKKDSMRNEDDLRLLRDQLRNKKRKSEEVNYQHNTLISILIF